MPPNADKVNFGPDTSCVEAITHITAYLHSEPHRCRIVVEELRLSGKRYYRVCLFLPKGRVCEDTEGTITDALTKIRSQIEPHGWRLGVNAARYDAVVGSDFNDVHIYVPGLNGQWRKVLALDPAPLTELASVEQQADFARTVRRAELGPVETQTRGLKKWWSYIDERANYAPVQQAKNRSDA